MSEIIVYEAFISYKHNSIDDKVATDVQKCIEHYTIPKELQKKTGIRRFRKVFRDTTELSVTEDLSSDIELALKNSNFLIVICSERTSSTAAPVYWCKLNRANGSTFRYNVKRPNPT